jgi:hypothetical protein
MNKLEILKQYQNGLVLKWDNSIWVLKEDGDQPSLWPVAHVRRNDKNELAFIIPKGTDIDNANAVLASLTGINDYFK